MKPILIITTLFLSGFVGLVLVATQDDASPEPRDYTLQWRRADGAFGIQQTNLTHAQCHEVRLASMQLSPLTRFECRGKTAGSIGENASPTPEPITID